MTLIHNLHIHLYIPNEPKRRKHFFFFPPLFFSQLHENGFNAIDVAPLNGYANILGKYEQIFLAFSMRKNGVHPKIPFTRAKKLYKTEHTNIHLTH